MNKNIEVNLDDCETVECVCGHTVWTEVATIKRIKGLLIGKTKDEFTKIPRTMCVGCGKDFNPNKPEEKETSPLRPVLKDVAESGDYTTKPTS